MNVISSGAIGHLCGTPIAITTLPPWNCCSRLNILSARLLGVEHLRVLGQPRRFLRHRPRTGRDRQDVVAVDLPALGLDLVLVEPELFGRIDVKRRCPARAGSLVAIQLVRSHAPDREVKQARLVHVLVRCGQHGDAHLAAAELGASAGAPDCWPVSFRPCRHRRSVSSCPPP